VFEIEEPHTGEEIDDGLRQLADEINAYIGSLDLGEFAAPQGEFWSPERHLRHLAKSVRAAAGGMRVSRLLLAIRFGRRKAPSRSYGEVVELYQSALAAGAGAGRFTPSERPPDVSAEEWCEGVMSRWQQACAALAAASGRWSEKALDRYQLPHPLLGKMTVREILFFTLYHNAHHVRRIRERRA